MKTKEQVGKDETLMSMLKIDLIAELESKEDKRYEKFLTSGIEGIEDAACETALRLAGM